MAGLSASLLAAIPDAVIAPAAAAGSTADPVPPSPAVSVPLLGARELVGDDDRDAEAFLARKRTPPVFPEASSVEVKVPAPGEPDAGVAGSVVRVGYPDPKLIAELGTGDLLIADAVAEQAVPVDRTVPWRPVPVMDAPALPVASEPAAPSPSDPAPASPAPSSSAASASSYTPTALIDPIDPLASGVPEGAAPPGTDATPPAGVAVPDAPASIRVETLDRKASLALGAAGFAFVVRRTDQVGVSGPVTLTLDVSGFAQAFGAGYLDRLKVVRLPECALAADGLSTKTDCGATAQVPTVVDRKAMTVTVVLPAAADPTVPAAPLKPDVPATQSPAPAAGGSTSTDGASPLTPASLAAAAPTAVPSGAVSGASGVFALTAGVSSNTGSFAATTLNAAGSWSAGGNSGSAGYDYPLVLPPATGGATPRVALSYSSGSVDGMTAAANTQASWAGLGWDLVPGFIERKYTSCSLDGHPGYSDLCWKTWNATLSLGGVSYPLIPDASDSTHTNWFVRDNPGYEVHRAVSGLADPNQSTTKEFWVVTTPDGTQYYFGRGYGTTTADSTNSTFTVPTFADDPGEPSYSASGWTAGQVSAQPWRWNLDRVVDPNGNITRYYYVKEVNWYSKLGNSSWPIRYTSGGLLDRIDYGAQSGSEASFGQQVVFDRQYRCTALDTTCVNAPGPNSPQNTDPTTFPDVPLDLICPINTVCSESSPSFFDTKRLAGVTTKALKSGSWKTVDSYAFTHSWLNPAGSIPQLWLNKIQRTGVDGTATKNQRPVLFDGTAYANRADFGGSVSSLPFYRLSTVSDEVGAQISFTYGQPDPCTTFSGWDTNTQDCYPVYWTPDGQPGGWGAFNKWVLTQVKVVDSTTGSPDIVTTYQYSNGGAWHHNDDPVIDGTPLTTWDQWRGYSTVKATTGSGGGRTSIKTRYYRGMHGDKLTTGGTKTVNVVDADGTTSTVDKDILAGKVREVQSFDTANAELTGSVTGYTSYNVKSGGTEWPDSEMVRPTTVKSRELYYTATGTATRTRLVTTDYDPTYGVPITVTDSGDLASTTDTSCVSSSYAPNASAWIINRPSAIRQYDGTCATGTLVGRTTYYYDDATAATTPPTAGNATRVQSYIDAATTTEVWMDHDAYGRVTRTNQKLTASATTPVPSTPSSTDGWATTLVAYNPASGPGSPTRIDTTNDKGQVSSVAPDGTRGLPLWDRKAEGSTPPTGTYQTSYGYDPLGRLTDVTLESASNPSYKFAYYDWNTAGEIAHVVTSALTNDAGAGTYIDSADYYDGLGRIREHQVQAPDQISGVERIITATRYDNVGRVAADTGPIHSAQTVGNSMYNPDGTTTPSETRFTYDELGRTLSSGLYASNALKFATTTTYYGDHTSTITPKNATTDYGKVTTYNDVFGNITQLQEVLPGAVVHSVDYGYDALHRLTSVATKAASGATTTTATTDYDWLGRITGTTDPDAGATVNTYDRGSRLTTTTTGTLRTVTTSYDGLSRPVDRTSSVTSGGSSTAHWDYDTQFPGSLDAQVVTAYTATGGSPVLATGLSAAADRTYTIAYSAYDSLQRPHTTTYTLPKNEGALGRSYVFGSDWDVAGRLKTVDSPAVGPLPAETITYSYDANGWPKTVTGTYTATPVGGASTAYTTPYVQNLTYTPTGQLETAALGTADTVPPTSPQRNLDTTVAINYGYASDTRWMNHTDVKIGAAGATQFLADQAISYDYAGLPTQITDSAPGVGQTECYRYDTQQRLTAYYTQAVGACATTGTDSSVVNGATVTSAGGPDGYAALYTVDYLGQLTGLTERRPATKTASQATTIVSTLNRGGARPHALMGVDRTIDAAATPSQTYEYDATGRQTKRTLPANSRTLGDTSHGVTSTITYDGNGRWLSSTDADPANATNTRTTGYIYDATGTLLSRHDDDAGDDLAAANARPGGQRTLWLGTGGSAGIGATGLAGTGGLQIQTSRKPGAATTTAGTASAVDPAQQLLTVSRAIVAPVLANGAPLQVATHTASALLSSSTSSGVVTQATAPVPGRVWFTIGDAHASLGGAGTPGITVAGNPATTDPASPQSQAVTVAGASIAAWPSGSSGAGTSSAGTAGIRRTTPYGADRTASATPTPLTGAFGATVTANTKTNTPGGFGGLGFLNASETTNGAEDGPVLPGATTPTGSGYATTGLVQLGARGYDPALGVFTAPDPVSNPLNPSDAGSYTYANSRVGIATDPTGLYTNKTDTDNAGTGDTEANCENRCEDGSGDTGDSNPVQSAVQTVWNPIAGFLDGAYTATIGSAAELVDYVIPGTHERAEDLQRWLRAHGGADTETGIYGRAFTAGHWTTGVATIFIPGVGVGAKAVQTLERAAAIFGIAGRAEKVAKVGSELADTAAAACSFAGATLVLMADGTRKPIEQVDVGDAVLATDPETGLQASKQVVEVFVHRDKLRDLLLHDGTALTTTEDHPYWSVDKQRFQRADELAPGERVLSASGRAVRVARLLTGTQQDLAYNLSVEGIHTYHVGEDAILVHNSCAAPWLDQVGFDKVSADHLSGAAGKSQFASTEDLFQLAEEAGSHPAVARADGRCERICSMGRDIGTDLSGQPTSIMTVVTNPNGRVITMHPGLPR
ncbi:MAG: polymorphic toxin-type HINT domain-containing protein [Candidatus Nanopelagicales bacterium]